MLSGRLLRCLALLALVASFAFAQGCGSDSTPPPPSTNATKTAKSDLAAAVSEAEINRYKSGTAQHTALEWWQAVQLNEPEAALPLYAEAPTLPNLAGQFNYVVGRLAGSVKVTSVKAKGDEAVVTVSWHKPGAPPRRVTIGMERKGGEWKIATVRFLDELVAQLQKAEAASG
jgi:ketosteroid isomerase-like protein